MKRKFSFSAKVGLLTATVGVVAALFVISSTLAATVTIDTFDEGFQSLTATYGNSPVSGTVDVAGVIGGERDVIVTYDSGDANVSVIIDSGAPPGSNRLTFNQDSNTIGHADIVWDGNDNDPVTLDSRGLGVDLTDNGTNDGIQLLVYRCDGNFDLGISVITGTSQAVYTLTMTTGVLPPGQSFFVPFTDFSGDQSVFTKTGAIEFRIRPTTMDVDLSLDLFEATAQTDWGDLPDTYSTTLASNGPRHIKGDLWLGSIVDLEANGFPTTQANGDDNNNLPDEDGIKIVPGYIWNPGNTVYITATVNGTGGWLVGWFDWNKDGDIADDGEMYNFGSVSNGANVISLTISSNYLDNGAGLYARFRLYQGDPGTPLYYGQVTNGEVEDYFWSATPTAITLSDLSARSTSTRRAAVLLAVAGLLVVVGVGTFALSRRRT